MMLENDKRKIKNPSSFIHEKSAPAFCYLKKSPALVPGINQKPHWSLKDEFPLTKRKKGYSDDI